MESSCLTEPWNRGLFPPNMFFASLSLPLVGNQSFPSLLDLCSQLDRIIAIIICTIFISTTGIATFNWFFTRILLPG